MVPDGVKSRTYCWSSIRQQSHGYCSLFIDTPFADTLDIVAQGTPLPPPIKPDVLLGDIGRSITAPVASVYVSEAGGGGRSAGKWYLLAKLPKLPLRRGDIGDGIVGGEETDNSSTKLPFAKFTILGTSILSTKSIESAPSTKVGKNYVNWKFVCISQSCITLIQYYETLCISYFTEKIKTLVCWHSKCKVNKIEPLTL